MQNIKFFCSVSSTAERVKEHNGRRQVNVVVHKMTKKTTGGRFDGIGEYAIMNLDDFYRILRILKENNLDKSLIRTE